jgi:hypothetical protein
VEDKKRSGKINTMPAATASPWSHTPYPNPVSIAWEKIDPQETIKK